MATSHLSAFELDTYLQDRAERPSFIMVEFGHREKPIVVNQPNLTGQRAYIGTEAWLRDPYGKVRKRIAELNQKLLGQNVSFVDQPMEAKPGYSNPDKSSDYLEGEYQPATVLPDGAAHEVFLGNVIGDYHLQRSRDNQERLLAEASRILDENGKIIIRETITPDRTFVDEDLLAENGLAPIAEFTQETDDWNKLEAIFDGLPDPYDEPAKGSYYLILGHAATILS